MEHSKRPSYDMLVFDFVTRHHATPKNIQVVRAIVEGNMKAVENCVRKGTFSDVRFKEILVDEKLQEKYTQMAVALDNGDVDAFEPLFNEIKDKADTFCGWLTYYNQHLELTLDIDLIKRSRLYYHWQDYREEN